MRLTIVALSLALAVPTAASTSHADVIHACVMKSNGKVRIVANAGMCKKSETAMGWNQSDPSTAPFKFVGFTAATVGSVGVGGNQNAGILEWTRACAAEFAGARACKSDEVVYSAAPPQVANPDDPAWVIPIVVAPNTDISSALFSTNQGTCANLIITNPYVSGSGLVVDGHGRYSSADCTEAHRIACCAPSN